MSADALDPATVVEVGIGQGQFQEGVVDQPVVDGGTVTPLERGAEPGACGTLHVVSRFVNDILRALAAGRLPRRFRPDDGSYSLIG